MQSIKNINDTSYKIDTLEKLENLSSLKNNIKICCIICVSIILTLVGVLGKPKLAFITILPIAGLSILDFYHSIMRELLFKIFSELNEINDINDNKNNAFFKPSIKNIFLSLKSTRPYFCIVFYVFIFMIVLLINEYILNKFSIIVHRY